jgi:AcrR family transcriptional regulator
MARSYTLKKRAEQQAETRRRIVEAAIELHGSVGPAQTTFSMIAERAGVQRHTLYAHFPDERSMSLACSGMAMERDPLPDAGRLRTMAGAEARLRAGLSALYGWYERNAALTACVLRDAEHHELTRDIAAMRMGPAMALYSQALEEQLSARQRALVPLAMSFFTWRSLTRDGGLATAAAAETMARMVAGAA